MRITAPIHHVRHITQPGGISGVIYLTPGKLSPDNKALPPAAWILLNNRLSGMQPGSGW